MSDAAYEKGSPFEVLNKPLPKFYEGWKTPPSAIVVHYSAGYTAGDCHKTLKDRGLSVHCTIERDGVIWKHVDDEHRCIHAGYGRWAGKSNMNHHALGFEVVNLGWLEGELPDSSPHYVYKPPEGREVNPGDSGTTYYRDETYGEKTTRITTKTDCSKFVDHRAEWEEHYWSVYPQEQIESVFWIIWTWSKKFNILPENIIGHEHVTPHRKLDPGPGFPWTDLKVFLETRYAAEMPEMLDPSHRLKERIKAVQSHLDRLGMNVGEVDGDWGKLTQAAAEKAVADFGNFYGFGNIAVVPSNCYELACAFRLVPGFDPGRS